MNGCDDLKFGDILRELLEENELSQKQFAEALNISAGAVGNYVRSNSRKRGGFSHFGAGNRVV